MFVHLSVPLSVQCQTFSAAHRWLSLSVLSAVCGKINFSWQMSLSTFRQRLKHFYCRPRSLTLSLIPGKLFATSSGSWSDFVTWTTLKIHDWFIEMLKLAAVSQVGLNKTVMPSSHRPTRLDKTVWSCRVGAVWTGHKTHEATDCGCCPPVYFDTMHHLLYLLNIHIF